ncbi:MAG: hypothetical protein ACHQX4_07180 [Gemmatimonadales bacterium]
MRAGAAAAILLLACCTDPRARPVAPIVQLSFAPGFRLKSPGSVVASLYLFDEDGLDSLDVSVRSADSALVGDSITLFGGDQELTLPVSWQVPSGIPIGTAVTLIARARDFKGFITADTAHLSVQDTI